MLRPGSGASVELATFWTTKRYVVECGGWSNWDVRNALDRTIEEIEVAGRSRWRVRDAKSVEKLCAQYLETRGIQSP